MRLRIGMLFRRRGDSRIARKPHQKTNPDRNAICRGSLYQNANQRVLIVCVDNGGDLID